MKEPDTKKSERRHIPIGRGWRGVLERLLIAIDAHGHVFTRQGLPIKSMRESFKRVCRDSGFSDIVFDDLRRRATTTLRRAGVDALTVMRITGHKTMAVFKRYNTMDEDDLTTAQHRMDTYMHTKALKPQGETL